MMDTRAETATTETAVTIDTSTLFENNGPPVDFLISRSAKIQRTTTIVVARGHKEYEMIVISGALTSALESGILGAC